MDTSTLQERLQQWTSRAHAFVRRGNDMHVADATKAASLFATYALRNAAVIRNGTGRSSLELLGPALLRIILLKLCANDVQAVFHCSRRLRHVVYDTRDLWKVVTLRDSSTSADFERLSISCSKPGPLELSLLCSVPLSDTFFQLLADKMARLTSLFLYTVSTDSRPLSGSGLVEGLSSGFRGALGFPAPLLETLTLYLENYTDPTSLYMDLFAGDAPLLRGCTVSGIPLPLDGCPAFVNLTRLHYHPRDLSFSFTLWDIDKLLAGLPQLNMLCLCWCSVAGVDDEISPQPHRSLKRVCLHFQGHFPAPGVGVVQDFFRARGATRFDYENDNHPYSSESAVPQRARIESLSARLWHYRLTNVPVEGGVGATRMSNPYTVRVNHMHWQRASLLSAAETFSHLVHLTISEFLWPQDEAMHAAPRLESLCVVLGACSDYRMFSDTSMLLGPGRYGFAIAQALNGQNQMWACPSLRTVHLAYDAPVGRSCSSTHIVDSLRAGKLACCCRDTLSISLRDVHHFVVACLGFGAAQLQLLRMSGVEPVDFDAMHLLLAVAEDVQISPFVDRVAVPADKLRMTVCTDVDQDTAGVL